MKRILLITVSLGLLSGCATLGTVANSLCKNPAFTQLGLEQARIEALKIPDPVTRDFTVKGIDLSLAALERCNVAR